MLIDIFILVIIYIILKEPIKNTYMFPLKKLCTYKRGKA